MMYSTNYNVAAKWCNNSLVLCNNIPEIDCSVFDNMRFSFSYYEDAEGNQYESEDDAPENIEVYEYTKEIFQWYITDCSENDVRFLEKHFGLLFTYSNLLDCYILCVDHCGTSWDYVYCETDLEYAKRNLGEEK